MQQMRDLRNYMYKQTDIEGSLYGQMYRMLNKVSMLSDEALTVMVYLQCFMMILSGSLVIANIKIGGLLLTLSMLSTIVTRDNPLLAQNSDYQWRMNVNWMLKDLAVAGIGMLIYMRK